AFRSEKDSLQRPSRDIIAEAKQEIGRLEDNREKKGIRQTADELYTQWVDRYHPVNKLASQAEKANKNLRPELNPQYTIRRFLGMGGIAEQRFENVLKPILKEMDDLKIDKTDMDVY